MQISQTPEFTEALRLMEEGGPFTFITGRAGTGKSTLLNHFKRTTRLTAPVLAPTGVAALNVGGETIHRFFRFTPGITVKDAKRKGGGIGDAETYLKADVLVIDEISMVRADLMDCMDQFLRAVRKIKRPFGGLRIVAIGDLYQLPPVVATEERASFSQLYPSPYFFASKVMRDLLQSGSVSFIELEKVYRQSDPTFVSLLNAVRNRSFKPEDLKQLNLRVQKSPPPEEAIVLTSINASADQLNEERLNNLAGKVVVFSGMFGGSFPEREAPTEGELRLKKGARVMCVANDPNGRFVNGSLGWVMGFEEAKEEAEGSSNPAVNVKLDDGRTISISFHTWVMYRSTYNRLTKTLDQERLGSFTQIPLKLAWAVTIHKSQGKTFDQVVIDLGYGAFAHGQTYVALSRCRTLEGLSLLKPVKPQDIRLDTSIVKFLTSLKEGTFIEEPTYEERLQQLF